MAVEIGAEVTCLGRMGVGWLLLHLYMCAYRFLRIGTAAAVAAAAAVATRIDGLSEGEKQKEECG